MVPQSKNERKNRKNVITNGKSMRFYYNFGEIDENKCMSNGMAEWFVSNWPKCQTNTHARTRVHFCVGNIHIFIDFSSIKFFFTLWAELIQNQIKFSFMRWLLPPSSKFNRGVEWHVLFMYHQGINWCAMRIDFIAACSVVIAICQRAYDRSITNSEQTNGNNIRRRTIKL